MEKDVFIVDFLRELNKAYDQLNDILFKSQLKGVQITVNEKSTDVKTLAYYRRADKFIWSDKYNSIAINPLLINGDYLEVLGSLVHEMVHQFNFENQGIIKTNRGSHHKKFRDKCKEVFLEAEYIHRKGWCNTTNTVQLVTIFNQLDIDFECLKGVVYNKELLPQPKIKTGTSWYTYVCQNCNVEFKIRKPRSLMCGDCKKSFDVIPPTKKDDPENDNQPLENNEQNKPNQE